MSALALLLALATYHEDVADPRLPSHRADVAAAVAAQTGPMPRRQWQALLLTVASHETHFSIRISDGKCKPHECDRGRAKGMWQLHRNSLNWHDWPKQDGNVALQAKLGNDALVRAYFTCRGSGVNWLTGTLNAYAGRRCGADAPGLRVRMATFRRLAGMR